jgi:hypothetical protein
VCQQTGCIIVAYMCVGVGLGGGGGGGVYNYCHVGDHTPDGCSDAVYNSRVRQKSSARQQQRVMHVGVLIQLVC